MKALIREGFAQLDLTTLDGYKIASIAEKTADKIVAIIKQKKNKSGDGTNVKSSKKQKPQGRK